MESFRNDLLFLLKKIKDNEPFAFVRFSDGEEFILQNKHLQILDNKVIVGNKIYNKGYLAEDHKNFIPEKHQFFRKALQDALLYQKHNYFIGICCKCCVGNERNKWFLDQLKGHNNLTWANLFVNGNYNKFIELFIPEFNKHNITIICNENADLNNMPFPIENDFRVGNNCIINNFSIIEELIKYTKNTKNKIFLFSASSLSEVLIHKLYKFNNNNTYIDIGTTLNYYMNMTIDRIYLINKWKYKSKIEGKICIW